MNAACNIVDMRVHRARRLQSEYRRKMEPVEFVSWSSDFLEEYRSEKRGRAAYMNALKHFRTYEEYKGRRAYMSNQISCETLIEFHCFLQRDKGLKMSTSSGIIGKIKYLLNQVYIEGGYDVCNSFRETRVRAGEPFSIALTPMQIDQVLFYDDLSEQDREIRDMFVFMCFAGFRYSDATRIGPEHIHGDIIIKKTQKTKKTVHVPIHSGIRKILERYGGRLPRARSAQHFNWRIKQICEWAGLTDIVHFETEVAGEVVMISKRMCELISSHTGRRSFVTNEFDKGNGVDVIKPMTGHSSADCLLRYDKRSGEKNARILAAKAS